MADDRVCLFCKGHAKEEDALVLDEFATHNNGSPLYICRACTQHVKKTLSILDEEEDEYDAYYNRALCGCGYESEQNRCYGQECRKYEDYEHSGGCTGYEKCKDCFGSGDV